MRPSAMVAANSSSHWRCSASTRAASPVRRLSAKVRVSSVRAARSAATITERMSRKSISSIPARAASARSRHSAALSRGAIRSASAMRGSALIGGSPSALAFSFMRPMARRTPGTPPRKTSSAKAR